MKLKIDFNIAKRTLDNQWPSFYMLGSCFAQNQAQRMKELGLPISANPFGISYNPASIESLLNRIANNIDYKKSDFEKRDTYFSWEHHGDFSYKNEEEAIKQSNSILSETKNQIIDSEVVVITLGTSLAHTIQNVIVSNCHKQPNKEFVQKQMGYEEVKASIQRSILLIKKLNSNAQIIFTVSPIRHLRSGVTESSRSKATLLAALREVLDLSTNTSYFPSYEIFMDELRDYRFAKLDMTHPTPQAEQYIWDRFCETYFSENTLTILNEVEKFNNFKNHNPKDAPLHSEQTTDMRNSLIGKYPFIKI